MRRDEALTALKAIAPDIRAFGFGSCPRRGPHVRHTLNRCRSTTFEYALQFQCVAAFPDC